MNDPVVPGLAIDVEQIVSKLGKASLAIDGEHADIHQSPSTPSFLNDEEYSPT